MSPNEKPAKIADDVVVTLDYVLTVASEVVDSSEDSDPVEFLQGRGNIITGLEKAIYGMKVGDKLSVDIPAAEGYGDIDPEAFMDVPRSEFPEDIPLEVGVELQMENEDDETVTAVIESVSNDSVRLDFNHPLAGKDLHFDVTVLDLREATAEELEHGHVHFEGFEEGEEIEFYEDDFEEDEEAK